MSKAPLSSFIKSPIQAGDLDKTKELIEMLRGKPGKDGKDGRDGISGKDGKDGRDGKDGKTPKKGKDYFTDNDKQEFASIIRDSIVELLPEVEEKASVKLTVQDIEGIDEFIKSYIPSSEVDEFTDLFFKELKKQSGANRIKDSAGMSLLIQKLGENFYKGYVAGPGFGGGAGQSGGTTSPLTTKGDVYTYSTVNDRLPVGTNGQVLTVDNTAATGLKWATASGAISFADNEVVSGSATTFTLANTPTVDSVKVFGAGTRLKPGAGNDYTISGANITIINGTYSAGEILADYRY